MRFESGRARRAVPLKAVTIRLPVRTYRLQELAARKSLTYKTYIKMLLHEALEKEGRTV